MIFYMAGALTFAIGCLFGAALVRIGQKDGSAHG